MKQVRYFSETHTSKESQLAGTPVTVQDSPQITELRLALRDYPNDRNLYLQLAHWLGQQLRYREAIETLTLAASRFPDDTELCRRRAPRYFSTLQLDWALEDYLRCDAACPDDLDVLYRLGILYVAIADYPAAKRTMARCIELTQEDGEMQVGCIFWYLSAWVRCHAEGEENQGAAAYRQSMEVGHHFAYRAAAELLCGYATPEQTLAIVDESVDDLDHSMILYGVYLHAAAAGDLGAARQAMERLLARDFYWAGFAYICALADSIRMGWSDAPVQLQAVQQGAPAQTVPAPLAAFFAEHPRAAVAFSGGADSAYLLFAARQCGCDVTAYYLHSAFQPAFELVDARRLADALHVPLRVLELDVLANPVVASNLPDRCYHCKRIIFDVILAAARADGFTLLLDGTNASDDAGDRPGMRALAELGVLSPLRICGVTKPALREYARLAGLFTWDKPAYACLATRVPTGRAITADDLARVERGEQMLMKLGLRDLRLRLLGDAARLQLPENQLDKALKMHQDIVNELSGDFSMVLLDLEPR